MFAVSGTSVSSSSLRVELSVLMRRPLDAPGVPDRREAVTLPRPPRENTAQRPCD